MAEQRATTDIKGGKVKGQKQVPTVIPDVAETEVREGQKLNKKDFTDAEWQELIDSGAVTEDPLDLVRPETYKASDVQAKATRDGLNAQGFETAPEPQDETNPANAKSHEDTAKEANETQRQVKEAEREFDEKLRTDPDFKAKLLQGFENDPRQHQAVLHAARQDFIAEKVYGDKPQHVPGRKKSVTQSDEPDKKGDDSGGGQ